MQSWPPLQLGFKLFFSLLFFFSLPLFAAEVYEKVYLNEKAALERCFPSSSKHEVKKIQLKHNEHAAIQQAVGSLIPSNNFQIFTSESQTNTYAIISHEQGKYRPITLMTLIKDSKVVDVMVMIYREKIGSKVRKKRFLKQFLGKDINTPLQVDYDIDGISGATVSSWAVAAGVKKGLHVAETLAKR